MPARRWWGCCPSTWRASCRRRSAPNQLHTLAFDGGEHIGKLVPPLQDRPAFGDQGPHALAASQGGALFDPILGALRGAAKGGENRHVPLEIHRIVAPLSRRDHAAIKVENTREFVPVEARLKRRRADRVRQRCNSPHQARVRLPLRRAVSAASASRAAISSASCFCHCSS